MVTAPLDSAPDAADAMGPRARALPAPPPPPAQADRRAALIEALTNLVDVPEDAEAVQFWATGTYAAFKPRNSWDYWLSQQCVITMIQINRAERVERKLRELQSLRAIDCWEADGRLAAEQAARHLARFPRQTYGKLLDTLAGCDWLIARWEELARVPTAAWTDAQRVLAGLIQPGGPDEPIPPGFAERWLQTLRDHRAGLVPADAVLRNLVATGLSAEVSPALALHRRETRALKRQLKWYIAQLRAPVPDRWDNPHFRPEYLPTVPEVAPDAEAPVPAEAPPGAQATLDPVDPPASPIAPAGNSRTNPSADLAADRGHGADEAGPPGRAASPADSARPRARRDFADLSDDEKAARVEERKRRVDPAQAAARLRRPNRRSA